MKHYSHLSIIPHPQKKKIVKSVKIVRIRNIIINFTIENHYWNLVLKTTTKNHYKKPLPKIVTKKYSKKNVIENPRLFSKPKK